MLKRSKRAAAAVCAMAVTVSCLCSVGVSAEELFNAGEITINSTAFPDDTFRKYVSDNFDKDKNGSLSQAECDAVTEIDVAATWQPTDDETDIHDMTGIEYFTKLQKLDCSENKIQSLDLSKNTALEILSCEGMLCLTSLNINKNAPLTELNIRVCRVKNFDFGCFASLKKLDCSSNDFSELNISKNTALEYLNCSSNPLTDIDVSNNTALEYLNCDFTQLTSLDVSKNTALKELNCDSNQLTKLDVSKNTALEDLACVNCNLSTIDLSKNTSLTELRCGFNTLTSLDVSNNTELMFLYCNVNPLTSLDVSKNTNLIELSCGGDQLKSLDVSKNTALLRLFCVENELTSLDVSKNTALIELCCNGNQLTSLDLSNNTALWTLDCSDNTYNIGKVSGTYPLSNLPSGFDPAKASGWNGATYDKTTNSLTNFTSEKVTYKYDCGNGKSETFTLALTLPPTAPAKPAVTSVTSGVNSVSLKWNAVNGAASYRVHYRLNGTSKWTYKNTVGTAMTVTGLTGGKKYDFLVRAYNGSAWSAFGSGDIITATPKVAAKPSFTSLTPGVNSVVLRWNAVDGAKSYRVFYRVSGTSKWSYKNTTKNAMNLTGLTGGKKYDFLVRSYNGSTWSAYTSADIKTAAPTAANKPVFSSVTPGVNSAVLRWNAVSGAKSYRVFYRVSGTSKWSYKNTTKNAMNLTGLTGGKTYEFMVRSYNGSTWSSYTSADIVKAAIKS